MYFASFQDLLAMNGHGPYVWSAYGIGLVVLAALVWWPVHRHRQQLAMLRRSLRLDGEAR